MRPLVLSLPVERRARYLRRMVLRLLLFCLLLAPAAPAAAYSVLTHQAVIDSTWDDCLQPLLQRRYPGADLAQLEKAKSFAYGGAILQDMGYYPLGVEFFTNLTHYVRAGEFVRNLLALARTRDEYAFALGALAHYAADNVGHPAGTNQIMPRVYPDMRVEFGPAVTYENGPIRHTELEFSFDVVQVAAGRYRTQDYHNSIGFRVQKDVLRRAFQQTYGLPLGQVFPNVTLSVGVFRYTVNHLLPIAARAAWYNKRQEIRAMDPLVRYRDSLYHANWPAFRQQFGNDRWPGFGARMLSRVLNVLPKFGPLKEYAFELPSAAGEAQFRRSYRATLEQYRRLVTRQPPDTAARPPRLPDLNLDLGQPTRPAAYQLADETYCELLRELYWHDFKHLTPALREQLLTFFRDGVPAPAAETDHLGGHAHREADDPPQARRLRQQTQAALLALRARTPQ